MVNSIYDIKINRIDGKQIDLHDYRGKKLMIVNVASECGLTPQYAALQELYEANMKNIAILACPCNDFGGQEPGNEEDVEKFCALNYGITFTITQKLNIVSDPHPLYRWLTQKSYNDVADQQVLWNFQKFLINPDGQWYKCLLPITPPNGEEVLQWLAL